MAVAYLFPGQGAQKVGMGRDVCQEYPAAREVFERANALLGFDLAETCFNGPEERLNATDVSQVAIFTMSVAVLRAAESAGILDGIQPAATAGLSLGEYTALYAAGALDFEDALWLVRERGLYMQQACEANPSGMVAVTGIEEEAAWRLCEQAAQGQVLCPANFNCPGQIVLAGHVEACQRAAELAEQFGASGAVPLRVAGAFHSPLMASARDKLAKALEKVQFREPRIPVACNVTGRYHGTVDEIRRQLAEQAVQPVRWQACIEHMISQGIEEFYEIGPGRVLSGLLKRIRRDYRAVNLSSARDLKKRQE